MIECLAFFFHVVISKSYLPYLSLSFLRRLTEPVPCQAPLSQVTEIADHAQDAPLDTHVKNDMSRKTRSSYMDMNTDDSAQ